MVNVMLAFSLSWSSSTHISTQPFHVFKHKIWVKLLEKILWQSVMRTFWCVISIPALTVNEITFGDLLFEETPVEIPLHLFWETWESEWSDTSAPLLVADLNPSNCSFLNFHSHKFNSNVKLKVNKRIMTSDDLLPRLEPLASAVV